jgi:hypothetical protein
VDPLLPVLELNLLTHGVRRSSTNPLSFLDEQQCASTLPIRRCRPSVIWPIRKRGPSPSAGKEPRYAVCFLTNGGGVTEATKAAQLTEWLGVRVTENQVSRPCLTQRGYI